MEKIIHRANTRGQSKYDWLDSKHNFSFAGYVDRERVRFGALRVFNDDVVQAGKGFGKHPHDNMEIISIPLKGALMHKDSMDHEQIIRENEVQVMSAGTGLFHSEYNASSSEAVNFLQLWIYPDAKNVKPIYDQRYFNPENAINKWQFLVNGKNSANDGTLSIHQTATISRTLLKAGEEIKYELHQTSYGSFLFVVHGEIKFKDETLSDRDAIGLSDIKDFVITATKDTYVINIEVPDINRN